MFSIYYKLYYYVLILTWIIFFFFNFTLNLKAAKGKYCGHTCGCLHNHCFLILTLPHSNPLHCQIIKMIFLIYCFILLNLHHHKYYCNRNRSVDLVPIKYLIYWVNLSLLIFNYIFEIFFIEF